MDFLKTNLDKLQKSNLFQKLSLKKGEFLFDEGDADNNIYFIIDGHLSVEKYTTSKRDETKQLAILSSGDFLGERAIEGGKSGKETLVKALKNSEVIFIDGNKGLDKFINKNIEIGKELMKYIIIKTNERLNNMNREISAVYEINKLINNLDSISIKTIFTLLDKIKEIIVSDYIIYIEKHDILDNYYICKYDTRIQGKMQDNIIEKQAKTMLLNSLYKQINISEDDSIMVNKLNIGEEELGYIICGKTTGKYSSNELRVLQNIEGSIAGLIKQVKTKKMEL